MRTLLLTIFLELFFTLSGECQYIFKNQYIDINGDTIRTYTVFRDSVVGKIKNGYPVDVWIHYLADGSYMKGIYKGFWGQYIGQWNYYDKENNLNHSKVYYSKKVAFGWKHKELVLDKIGNKTLLTKHKYKFSGLTDSKRIYKFIEGRKILVHKDLESIFRVIEKEYYDNGMLKYKTIPRFRVQS